LPSSLASCEKVYSGFCSLRIGRKSEEKKMNAVFAFFGAFLSFFFLPFLPLTLPSPFVFFDPFDCLAGAFLFVVFFFLYFRFAGIAFNLITSWFSGRHNIYNVLFCYFEFFCLNTKQQKSE